MAADKQKALAAFADLFDALFGDDEQESAAPEPTTKKRATKAAASKPAPEPEPDEDESDEDEQADLRAELEGLSLPALRKRAIAAGFDAAEVKNASAEDIIDSLIEDSLSDDEDEGDAEDADEDSEDESDEDEADEAEDDEPSRDDLIAMGLRGLKKYAQENYEVTAADLKGLDVEAIADLLLDGGEDEDAEADEDSDEDSEGDDFTYEEDELQGMTLPELKGLAEEFAEAGYDIEVPAKVSKAALVALILEAQEQE